MALVSSDIYRLTADQLRKVCAEEEVDSAGSVRVLSQGLVRHLNDAAMATKRDDVTPKEGVLEDLSGDQLQVGPHVPDDNSHAGASAGSNSVLVDLMSQFSPLVTEEPEAVLRFVVRLNEIYTLGLGDDRSFVVRILPLVSAAMLRFFGDCLRNGRTWEQCKGELLQEIFPHFVRERMVRDHISFNFH